MYINEIKVFNEELQKQIIKAIKAENVSVMPKNPFKDTNDFKAGFDMIQSRYGIIHTPYRDVRVDIRYAWEHFKKNTHNTNRDNIKGAFFETFRNPLFIVAQMREGQELPSVYFYKPYYDNNKNLLNIFGIGVDNEKNVGFRTFYLDSVGNRLENLLNDKKLTIIYKKQ